MRPRTFVNCFTKRTFYLLCLWDQICSPFPPLLFTTKWPFKSVVSHKDNCLTNNNLTWTWHTKLQKQLRGCCSSQYCGERTRDRVAIVTCGYIKNTPLWLKEKEGFPAILKWRYFLEPSWLHKNVPTIFISIDVCIIVNF